MVRILGVKGDILLSSSQGTVCLPNAFKTPWYVDDKNSNLQQTMMNEMHCIYKNKQDGAAQPNTRAALWALEAAISSILSL